MRIGIYVAVARNGVIGNQGGMPWRLSTDLKRFQGHHHGQAGGDGPQDLRRASVSRCRGRRNIVVTRNRDYPAEGADVVASLPARTRHWRKEIRRPKWRVIGGR